MNLQIHNCFLPSFSRNSKLYSRHHSLLISDDVQIESLKNDLRQNNSLIDNDNKIETRIRDLCRERIK